MQQISLTAMWIAEIAPLCATLFCFIYGLNKFFKRGKPLFLQSLTMAMGCHSLGSIYHLCQTLTVETVVGGFTPAYLGRIGFFLFLITASYGQLDKIVDDGSKKMRPARLIAFAAPVCALLLFIPNLLMVGTFVSTKVSYAMVWLPALVSVYFNLKHAIIPDLDFGFIKAIKPYNIFALLLSFSELLCLTAWHYYYAFQLDLSAILFAVLCVCTMLSAKKGAEKWTI